MDDSFQEKQQVSKKLNWNKTLYDYRIPLYAEAYEKWDKNLQMECQHILEQDLPRTRSNQPKIQKQSVQKALRRIATFFCKQNNFNYQQGLLDVIIPFALLHGKKFKTSKCYAYFNLFMKKHIPKILMQRIVNNKKQLPHTILALNLTNCLVNFHYPQVFQLLKSFDIEMSLIVTQELMTIFAKNLKLEYVYLIFDKIINKNDPNFLFFLSVALIGVHEEKIFQKCHDSDFYKFIQNLKQVESNADLQIWFSKAQKLEKQTPKSFVRMADNLGFNHKSILSLQDIENMLHSEKIFYGELLPIYRSQVDENLKQFIFVISEGSLPAKYSYISFENSEKYDKKDYRNKIFVLVISQEENLKELNDLLKFAKEFERVKIGLLRERLQIFQKKSRCVLF